MRFLNAVAGAATAAAVMLAAGSVAAQDKRVRIQLAGAFPSTTAIVGPAQARVV